MRIIKKISLMISLVVGLSVFAAPTVTDVVAKQRYPWNGLVDITCKVSGIEGKRKLVVSAVMPDSGKAVGLKNFWVVRNGVKSTNYEVNANGDYRLLWDAKADLGEVCYEDMVVRVTLDDMHEKVQLWESGPYWATTNIGAEEPWESGYYFWWGDTVGYKRESDKWVASDGSNLDFSFEAANVGTCGKDVATLQREGWITSDGILSSKYDAAYVNWGEDWRMPTTQELGDLNNNCDWTWTSMNGVNGYIVRGRAEYASNSIFLPCAGDGYGTSLNDSGSCGCYWSSVPGNGNYSWYLIFHSSFHGTGDDRYRLYGQSVRPVQNDTTVDDDSESFLLNTKDEPLNSSPLSYDSSWIGCDANATVVVTDNGVEEMRIIGKGDFYWSSLMPGKHTLTYTTYVDGIAQREVYTATIFVDWKYTVNDGKATMTATTLVSGNVLIPSEIDGYEVVAVADSVFKNCNELVSVTVPGDIDMSMVDGVSMLRGDFPIPDISNSSQISTALKGSSDANLAWNIKTAAEYAAYRAWALGLEGVTPQQVKDSAYSWLSYALNTDKLIIAAPKEGDVVIDTFEIAATEGAFEFTVKIDGIAVGDSALEANLKKVFDVEGAENLASGGAGFSSDNVEVNVVAPENGNVKFIVTPKMGNGEKPDSFFFRVKMK